MKNEIAFEFDIKPKKKKSGKLAGMAVRIVVKDQDVIVITGKSGGEEFKGQLVLRKKRTPTPSPRGGDECFINGVWYSPCPIGPGGGGGGR